MGDSDIRPVLDSGGVPMCDSACPSYDGKRCRILGFKPGTICEPAVVDLSARCLAAESTLANQLQVTVTARQAVADVVVQRDAARADAVDVVARLAVVERERDEARLTNHEACWRNGTALLKERDAAREESRWAILHLSKLAVTLGLTDHEWSASSPEQVLARAEEVVRERDAARAETERVRKQATDCLLEQSDECERDVTRLTSERDAITMQLASARADTARIRESLARVAANAEPLAKAHRKLVGDNERLTSEVAALRAEVERLRPVVERVAVADIDDRLGAVKIYERPGRPHPEYTAEWLPDAARHALGLPEREEQS